MDVFLANLSIFNHVLFMLILTVRTGFESLAQKTDKLRPKKPKTMNLKRVGWKIGLR